MTKNEDLKALLPCPYDAISNLINNQEQLDMDGCMVAVSRQALDEVLAFANNTELYGYTRPTVTPADTAMEDAAQREPAGCTGTTGATAASVGITSSTTDGDAERALEALDLMRLRCYSHAEISNSPKDMRDWINADYEKIRTALQTRTLPANPVEASVYDVSCLLYGNNEDSRTLTWLDLEEAVVRLMEKFPDGLKIRRST